MTEQITIEMRKQEIREDIVEEVAYHSNIRIKLNELYYSDDIVLRTVSFLNFKI